MSMDDLLLMDDLLEWLALGFWTTLMDKLEMVQFFSSLSIAPISRAVQSVVEFWYVPSSLWSNLHCSKLCHML